ncbi:MAG: hypothetical protein KDJ77_15075, partial [Rhodobiaceae bacterium]|nr:hypothetical protein [Rhodobiaceae bacterium]
MVNPVLWRDLGKVHTVDTSTDDHYDPKVIQLTNGNVVVAYFTDAPVAGNAFTGLDIGARIYSSTGELIKDEFRLNFSNTAEDEFDFELAADDEGGFTVLYEQRGINGTPSYNIRLDRFYSTGDHAEYNSFLFDGNNTTDGIYFRNPNVTSLSATQILGTYERYDENQHTVYIVGKIFNGDTNSASSEFNVDGFYNLGSGTETVRGHSSTTLTTGEHVVAIADGNASTVDAIYVRILNGDGTTTGQPGRITVDASHTDAFEPH